MLTAWKNNLQPKQHMGHGAAFADIGGYSTSKSSGKPPEQNMKLNRHLRQLVKGQAIYLYMLGHGGHPGEIKGLIPADVYPVMKHLFAFELHMAQKIVPGFLVAVDRKSVV